PAGVRADPGGDRGAVHLRRRQRPLEGHTLLKGEADGTTRVVPRERVASALTHSLWCAPMRGAPTPGLRPPSPRGRGIRLRWVLFVLLATACGQHPTPPDAGAPDAGTPDAGQQKNCFPRVTGTTQFNLDVVTGTVSGTVTVNGAPMPDSPGSAPQ